MPLAQKLGLMMAIFWLSLPMFAQQRVATPLPAVMGGQLPTTHPPVIARRVGNKPRQEPCWQEAGISKGAMQQRKSIEQSTEAEIHSLCANSSLTPQQRHQQIRAIRERTRQQVDALITPQQREAIKACQEARGKAHPGTGGFHGGGGGHGEGPCGELNAPKEPTTEPER
jgi:hypothetical protein